MSVWKISQIKILLSAIFSSSFSTQLRYTVLYQIFEADIKNACSVIYKIKSSFSQPVQGTRDTTLLYFYENWTAVYCKNQNANQDFLLVRSTLYFLNDF